MAKPFLDYERLLRVPHVENELGFDTSPDGSQAALAWNLSGQWEIFLLDLVDGGEPRQVSGGKGAKFNPRFSPDGKKLLYVLDEDGSEEHDIILCDLASGKQTNLTPGTADTIQPRIAWSPDGRQVAFISNRTGRFSTYLQGTDDTGLRRPEEPRLVLDEGGPNEDLSWSPNGRWLAVTVESRLQSYAIFLVSLEGEDPGGSPAAYSLAVGGEELNARWPSWSPDGKSLAFSGEVGGYYQIGVYDLAGGGLIWLTSGRGDKSEPDWSPDGRRLAYVLSDGPQTWLAIQTLEGGETELFQVEDGLHTAPRFAPGGEAILFFFESPRRPADLWRLSLESRDATPLTRSLPADLSPDDFVMPEHVCYPGLDGRSVPALLYKPAPGALSGGGKPPAVVVIHGGPSWLFPYLWYPFMAHMASRGWVVLAPNYRGSTGYGSEWQLANRFEIGRGDTADVAAGVEYLVSRGLADAERIAVSGRSHGGYLTMSCLTEHPALWAAGSAVVPFLNWFTSHENSRQDLQHWDRENMGSPEDCADLWRERSPFFHLERVQAPVQLICGANDPRCPASESIAARDALLELGKTVDFLLYPDEGHTFLKVENIVEHELRRVAFLARSLEGPGEGTTYAPPERTEQR